MRIDLYLLSLSTLLDNRGLFVFKKKKNNEKCFLVLDKFRIYFFFFIAENDLYSDYTLIGFISKCAFQNCS